MQRIDFETGAVASLQRRVAEIEEINDDLVAFARGHAGAVTAIHAAVLAMMTATDRDALCRTVAWEWPGLLKVDSVALAWGRIAGDAVEGFRADRDGVAIVEPRLVARMVEMLPAVTIRGVTRAHPLFGAAGAQVQSEALIRLEGAEGVGLLALGQRAGGSAEGRHGVRLLRFLGETLSLMIERCTSA